jgi:hypothetical protein
MYTSEFLLIFFICVVYSSINYELTSILKALRSINSIYLHALFPKWQQRHLTFLQDTQILLKQTQMILKKIKEYPPKAPIDGVGSPAEPPAAPPVFRRTEQIFNNGHSSGSHVPPNLCFQSPQAPIYHILSTLERTTRNAVGSTLLHSQNILWTILYNILATRHGFAQVQCGYKSISLPYSFPR